MNLDGERKFSSGHRPVLATPGQACYDGGMRLLRRTILSVPPVRRLSEAWDTLPLERNALAGRLAQRERRLPSGSPFDHFSHLFDPPEAIARQAALDLQPMPEPRKRSPGDAASRPPRRVLPCSPGQQDAGRRLGPDPVSGAFGQPRRVADGDACRPVAPPGRIDLLHIDIQRGKRTSAPDACR